MDKKTQNTIELVTAWIGPVWGITYGISWVILGHNYPPPNFLGMSSQELVSEHYGKYQTSISIGMALSCIFGVLYIPWTCLLASLMKGRDGTHGILGHMQLIGGLLTSGVITFCPAVWLVCAVYAIRLDPDVIMALHAFSWFIFDITTMVTTMQAVAAGLFVILEKEQTIFPIWTGWAAIAAGTLALPIPLIAFAAHGPFAVAGTWNFYIVYCGWGIAFFTPFSYYIFREIYNRRRKLEATMISST